MDINIILWFLIFKFLSSFVNYFNLLICCRGISSIFLFEFLFFKFHSKLNKRYIIVKYFIFSSYLIQNSFANINIILFWFLNFFQILLITFILILYLSLVANINIIF